MDRTALVTGGTGGLGAAVVGRLLDDGWRVVVPWVAERELERVQPRERLELVEADLFEPDAVAAVAARAAAQDGAPLRAVVNLVGGYAQGPRVAEAPIEGFEAQLRLNLRPTYLVTQAALPLLRRGGTIINNLSVAATRIFAGQSAYCAAKHGALGLTRTLREELHPRGIRVIALMPGATNTDIWNQFWPEAPRKRMLRAETVAQAVLDALLLPSESTMEEITLMPTGGAL